MSDNIILIGFMGTGKDTVGKALAARTGWAFLSTDTLIELQEHKLLVQIFAQQGEAYFRAKEQDIINRIKDLEHIIVATGGGSVLDPNNREALKQMGQVICLTANQKVLEKRLGATPNRPLITQPQDIDTLLQTRQGVYEFADYTLDTSQMRPDEVASEILQKYFVPDGNIDAPTQCISVSSEYKTYPVYIGSNLQPETLSLIKQVPVPEQVVIITNPLIGTLYGERFTAFVKEYLRSVHQYIIPDGECYKTLKTAEHIYDFLASNKISCNDLLVALGGGVVCDIAGFVASTYKRGMQLMHMPTTLLAQVDAAIGGKTGLDHTDGKNLIGSFYQPSAVLCEVSYLASLSEREFRNGLAEIIKYSLIEDSGLFTMLKNNAQQIAARNLTIIADVIKRCVSMKSSIVSADEREEKKIRQKLNFGHTVGHALESFSGYQGISHGEAVALGMVAEMKWAADQKLLAREKAVQAIDLVTTYGLPSVFPKSISIEDIRNLFMQDKKVHNQILTLPVLTDIGRIEIKEVQCKNFL